MRNHYTGRNLCRSRRQRQAGHYRDQPSNGHCRSGRLCALAPPKTKWLRILSGGARGSGGDRDAEGSGGFDSLIGGVLILRDNEVEP
jgi:hypothetical protein